MALKQTAARPFFKKTDEFVTVKFPPSKNEEDGKYRVQHFKSVCDQRIPYLRRCVKHYGKLINVRDYEDEVVKKATLYFAGI